MSQDWREAARAEARPTALPKHFSSETSMRPQFEIGPEITSPIVRSHATVLFAETPLQARRHALAQIRRLVEEESEHSPDSVAVPIKSRTIFAVEQAAPTVDGVSDFGAPVQP